MLDLVLSVLSTIHTIVFLCLFVLYTLGVIGYCIGTPPKDYPVPFPTITPGLDWTLLLGVLTYYYFLAVFMFMSLLVMAFLWPLTAPTLLAYMKWNH